MYSQHPGQDRFMGRGNQEMITPIGALNSYSKTVTIKGRVIDKKELRQFTNAKGQGHVFSFVVMDKDQSTINAVAFNDAALQWDPVIQVGKVYTFSQFVLRMSNRPSTTTTSDYEVTLDSNSQITEQKEDTSIGQQSYKTIRPLDFVVEYNTQLIGNNNATFDFLGVVTSSQPATSFQTKAGKQSFRRDFVFVDRTLLATDVTLWGDLATKYDDSLFEGNPVILMKGMRIHEYNGVKSLQGGFTTTLTFNPPDDRCRELRKWYETVGKTSTFNHFRHGASSGPSGQGGGGVSRFRLDHFTDIDESRLVEGSKPVYLNIVGNIMNVRVTSDREPWYTACPQEGCKRKVKGEEGQYFCEKCQLTFPNCLLRYILQFALTDDTGTRQITAFHDEAVAILGMEPEQLREMLQDPDDRRLAEFHANITNRMLDIVVTAAVDSNPTAVDGEQRRVRYRVFRVNAPLEYSHVSKLALAEINHIKEIIQK